MTGAAPDRRIRIDMHLHTDLSFDCLSRPDAIVAAARARGIDRLVVTDHDQVDAAIEMREREPGLVIVGEEVRTREGFDLIGIFLSELIPSRTPAREACEMILAQGGVTYVPHPFDLARSGAGRHLDGIADLVDVVEVHNSRCVVPAFDRRAAAWAERHGKLTGAGSDAHTVREIGRGVMEVPPFEHTRQGLLAALHAGAPGRCVRSSPLVRASSTYAKIRKRFA